MTNGSNEQRAIVASRCWIEESVKNGLSRGYIATEWRIKGRNRRAAIAPSKSCEDRLNFIEILCCIATSPIMMVLYLASAFGSLINISIDSFLIDIDVDAGRRLSRFSFRS